MKTRPAAVIFILVTVTLDILAMGLIIPVLPKLILDFLGGEMARPIRCGLRADAVFLFTLTRSFVRSVWKTPDHPALKSGSRIGLHRDGDGAHVELAFPGPNYFRHHDFKHSDRDGLHRRRYAETKASWSVRHDRRGIRHWIHVRPGDRWIGGRRQSASGILDCSSA